MHDLKAVRDDPQSFDRSLTRRGLAPQAQSILDLDHKHRALIQRLQELQTRRNDVSKQIGQRKSKGENADDLIAETAKIKNELPEVEAQEREAGAAVTCLLEALPNLPAADVPSGKDAADNKEVRRWREPRKFNFQVKDHVALGERLGMDIPTASKMSGARFTLLKGQVARLERALAQFMLDLHTTEFGYTETSPPLMVRDNAAYGTGQLPKFGEDLFRTNTGHWLIPTAEVPMTNIVAGEILDEDKLPLRFTAHTPCFRSEAGAAGKDTTGMLRQHQFYKVELVSIAHPDQSDQEHTRMTECAQAVLERLELPYRTVVLCTGDMGFAAEKTYDIEVWLPGQDTYREISSCSNCGDFQARRMNARFRPKGGKGTRFVHTLNGSGLAVGRTLIAVLENYQQEDGSVAIPKALLPYMGGVEALKPDA
ncbi:MAG: serine--tRNA ligase [Alphaproteobacteria bacterium]|nr:serine--tRNA ligase [Alphaproteobacteria bacterium]